MKELRMEEYRGVTLGYLAVLEQEQRRENSLEDSNKFGAQGDVSITHLYKKKKG